MSNQHEIEAQKQYIEVVRAAAQGWREGDAQRILPERGYIPTSDDTEENWTIGLEYVVLDADNDDIAWRTSGDFREDGPWEIGTADEFADALVADAEEVLDRLHEVSQESEWDNLPEALADIEAGQQDAYDREVDETK